MIDWRPGAFAKWRGAHHRRTIPPNRRLLTAPARPGEPAPPGGDQCASACRRAGLQMARTTATPWKLAHDLHADESLEQSRRAGSGVGAAPSRADHRPQAGGRPARPHDPQRASRRDRRSKKTARQPSANPAAAGPPGFIGVPRLLGAPCVSPSPRARRALRPKAVHSGRREGAHRAAATGSWTAPTRAMKPAN